MTSSPFAEPVNPWRKHGKSFKYRRAFHYIEQKVRRFLQELAEQSGASSDDDDQELTPSFVPSNRLGRPQLIVPSELKDDKIMTFRFTSYLDVIWFFESVFDRFEDKPDPNHAHAAMLKALGTLPSTHAVDEDSKSFCPIAIFTWALTQYAQKRRHTLLTPQGLLALVLIHICTTPREIASLSRSLVRQGVFDFYGLSEFLYALAYVLRVRCAEPFETFAESRDIIHGDDDEEEQEGMANFKAHNKRLLFNVEKALHFMQSYTKANGLTNQQKAVVAFNVPVGKTLLVVAYAGTGKTSTLVEYAEARPMKSVIYIAFNTAVRAEAQGRFPPNVECRTMHSLAWAWAKERYDESKLKNFDTSIYKIRKMFNCTNTVATYIRQTLQRYCRSDKLDFENWMVPRKAQDHHARLKASNSSSQSTSKSSRKSPWGKKQALKRSNSDGFSISGEKKSADVKEYIQMAKKLWNKMKDPDDALEFFADGYLKMYQLKGEPLSGKDYVLFDEAQDANDVMISVIKRQKCSKVVVGDEHQRIYGFRGASAYAFEKLKPDYTLHLSKSFRFGLEVANVANVLFSMKREEVALLGDAGIRSRTLAISDREEIFEIAGEGQCAFICRTNQGIFREAVKLLPFDKTMALTAGTKAMKDLLKKIKEYFEFSKGRKSPLSEQYRNWDELKQEAEDCEDNDKLSIIGIVETYKSYDTIDDLIEKLLSHIDNHPSTADCVLTTTHKAKGLGYQNVILADDFVDVFGKYEDICARYHHQKWHSNEDLNLLYVACARAKKNLFLNDSMTKLCEVHWGVPLATYAIPIDRRDSGIVVDENDVVFCRECEKTADVYFVRSCWADLTRVGWDEGVCVECVRKGEQEGSEAGQRVEVLF